ncbi:MAG: RNA polymerase sigma factor [Acidimicrobiales bacterium]
MRAAAFAVEKESVTLGSSFTPVVRATRSGDIEAFASLYADLHPGLGRYLRFCEPSLAAELSDRVWRNMVVQLANFGGTERDFRVLLYTVARRHLGEAGLSTHPSRGEAWQMPTDPVEQAIALLGNSLDVEHGQVIVLRVVGDLDTEDTAHVLRTTTGAVRLTQYRALVMLVNQFSLPGSGSPNEDTLSSFLDVADPVPNLIFQGALPPWQARGPLAPVARIVATARRRASDEERTPADGLNLVVEALAELHQAPTLERRARWSWAPGDRRARPLYQADSPLAVLAGS